MTPNNEISEISAQIGKERYQLRNRFRDPIFQKVNFKIAHKALRMVADSVTQIKKQAKEEIDSRGIQNDQYSNQFETIWGIPCGHKISGYLQQDGILEISDVCSQRHLHDPWEVEITSEIETALDRPLLGVIQELGDKIQTLILHKQLAARIELEKIRDTDVYGSGASSLISVQTLTAIRPKGRPSCALNSNNAVGASAKRRQVAESSTNREPSVFEYMPQVLPLMLYNHESEREPQKFIESAKHRDMIDAVVLRKQ